MRLGVGLGQARRTSALSYPLFLENVEWHIQGSISRVFDVIREPHVNNATEKKPSLALSLITVKSS